MTDWVVGMEAVCISEGVYKIPFNAIKVVKRVELIPKGTLVEAWLTHGPANRGTLAEDFIGLQFKGMEDCEHVYNADFFRPLQKRKTDISVFTSILISKKQKEDA